MVVSIFLCPNNSIIVKKSTPAITKRVANVCLRSWKRKSSIPAYSRTVLKDFLISTYGALVLELINTYSDSLCIDCNTLYKPEKVIGVNIPDYVEPNEISVLCNVIFCHVCDKIYT